MITGLQTNIVDCFTYFTIFPIYSKWGIIRHCCVPVKIEINCIWSEASKKCGVADCVTNVQLPQFWVCRCISRLSNLSLLLEVNGKTLLLMDPVKCQTIIKTMHAVSFCIFCFCYGEMLSSGCLILWCLFVVDVLFCSATREIVLTVLSYSSIILFNARTTETCTSFPIYKYLKLWKYSSLRYLFLTNWQ